MSLKNCHNFEDFRKLAKKKLPSPIFHYIDGGQMMSQLLEEIQSLLMIVI